MEMNIKIISTFVFSMPTNLCLFCKVSCDWQRPNLDDGTAAVIIGARSDVPCLVDRWLLHVIGVRMDDLRMATCDIAWLAIACMMLIHDDGRR